MRWARSRTRSTSGRWLTRTPPTRTGTTRRLVETGQAGEQRGLPEPKGPVPATPWWVEPGAVSTVAR